MRLMPTLEWPDRRETVVPAATAAAAATDAAMNRPRLLRCGRWVGRGRGSGADDSAWPWLAIADSRAARPPRQAACVMSATRAVEDSSSSRAFMRFLPGWLGW